MREIQLTKGQVALVDAEDFEKVSQYRWHAYKDKNTFYARATIVVSRTPYKQRTLLMHRFIMDAPDGMEVDHINGDGLNNQKHNLRLCTHAENMRNVRTRGKSQYLGVCWRIDLQKWVARMYAEGVRLHLGLFTSEIEAARARDEAAKKYHGEFARLNFPDEQQENK